MRTEQAGSPSRRSAIIRLEGRHGMSIFSRFFKSQPNSQEGIDVRGVRVIPTKCPTCGKVGDFPYTPEAHAFVGVMQLDAKTFLHVLECPYCTAGMLLCIRDGRLMSIEPFKDDPPSDVFEAVKRTRTKLGI